VGVLQTLVLGQPHSKKGVKGRSQGCTLNTHRDPYSKAGSSLKGAAKAACMPAITCLGPPHLPLPREALEPGGGGSTTSHKVGHIPTLPLLVSDETLFPGK
jgi:hypothetical protein